MAAYQEPRVSGAQALIDGWNAMSQSQLDDARRQEIAAKVAAQYQGAQSQGGVNTIQFAPGVAQDPGQNATMDQTATQRLGQQSTPPPIQEAPKQTAQAMGQMPPPPAGLPTPPLLPPALGQPSAAHQEAPTPVGEPPPLPPEATGQAMPPPPMSIDEGKLEQFRSGIRQRMMIYSPLTRKKLVAQGLTDPEIDQLRGIGPISEELKSRLQQLGSAQLPNYAFGTETNDFKQNAELMADESKMASEKVKASGHSSWKSVPDTPRLQLISEMKSIEANPAASILEQQRLTEVIRQLTLYDAAQTGTLKQEPTDPEDRALVMRARAYADLQRNISGLGLPGTSASAGKGTGNGLPPEFAGTAVEKAWGGMNKNERNLALQALKAKIPIETIAGSDEVKAALQRRLRR